MAFQTNTSRYVGHAITKIAGSDGTELDEIYMDDELNIFLANGDVLTLKIDWRGDDAYISQYEPNLAFFIRYKQ